MYAHNIETVERLQGQVCVCVRACVRAAGRCHAPLLRRGWQVGGGMAGAGTGKCTRRTACVGPMCPDPALRRCVPWHRPTLCRLCVIEVRAQSCVRECEVRVLRACEQCVYVYVCVRACVC